MSNPYYTPSGWPSTDANGDSASARSELNAVAAGFAKLPPTLTANAIVSVNSAGTGMQANTALSLGLNAVIPCSSSAGTNTITFSATPTQTAYVTDQIFRVESFAANTGATTVNVDGLGARSLVAPGGTALVGGEIPDANYPMLVWIRAADAVLVNPCNIGSSSRVNNTGGQAILVNNWTLLNFSTIVWDDMAEFNTATHLWTVKHAGTYIMGVGVLGSQGVATTRELQIYVNGALSTLVSGGVLVGTVGIAGTGLIRLSAGDTVGAWYFSGLTDTVTDNAAYTYATLEKVK